MSSLGVVKNFRCAVGSPDLDLLGNAQCFMRAYWLEDFFERIGFDIPVKSIYDATIIPLGANLTQINELVEKGDFPTAKGLAPVILWCLFFCLFRYVLERSLFKNLATTCMSIRIMTDNEFAGMTDITPEIKDKILNCCAKPPRLRKSESENEAAVAKSNEAQRKWEQDIENFSKEHNVSIGLVKSYQKFRKQNRDNRHKISKFVEAFWRGVFYLWFIILGYVVLFNCDQTDQSYNGSCESNGVVEWLNDLSKMWVGYPYHRLADPIRLYYFVELGCYIHQLIWLDSVTTSRKDALEMIVHHIATIILLLLSYLTNHYRVGSLILMVHDIADVFLEFGKCINYTSLHNKSETIRKYSKIVCDGFMFPCFVLSFFLSRLYIYPFYILRSYFFDGFLCFPEFGPYKGQTLWFLDNSMEYCHDRNGMPKYGFNWLGGMIFTFCLLLLQILHVYWFYLIMRMVYRMLKTGEVEGDIRSEEEVEVSELTAQITKKNKSGAENKKKSE